MSKDPNRWGKAIGLVLQRAIGQPDGGFLMDESGHPVEDYLEKESPDEMTDAAIIPGAADPEESSPGKEDEASAVDRFFGFDF